MLGCDSAGAPAQAASGAASAVVLGGEVVQAAPGDGAAPAAEGAALAQSQPSAGAPAAGATGPDGRPLPLAAGQTGHYGAAFTVTTPAVPLSQALQTCVGTGQACLVDATVERVCQVSGCWFTVAAPDVQATVRIRMKDYAFFVPRNIVGARSTFEGTLTLEDVPEQEAQHYADDEAAAGGERRVVDGPERTYAFMITGVRVTMP